MALVFVINSILSLILVSDDLTWSADVSPPRPLALYLSGTKSCKTSASRTWVQMTVSHPFFNHLSLKHSANFIVLPVEHCQPIIVPRFKSTFDLYNPNGSQAYPTAITPIIPRDVADTEGRTYVATLRFDSLGWKAKWRRAVWKEYRLLYVGCLPSMHEKPWYFGWRVGSYCLFTIGNIL